jgi:hypothetical protein
MPKSKRSCTRCKYVRQRSGDNAYECDAPVPNCLMNIEKGLVTPDKDAIDCDCYDEGQTARNTDAPRVPTLADLGAHVLCAHRHATTFDQRRYGIDLALADYERLTAMPEKGKPTMKWTNERPRTSGYYFAVVRTTSGDVRTTVVRAYSSKPSGTLRYLGQPKGEPGKTFPEHNEPPDRIYWEGDNFTIDNDKFLRFSEMIPEPPKPEETCPCCASVLGHSEGCTCPEWCPNS